MESLPSCNARFDVITHPFRHLLLKHHLFRMNPVALSVFTTYFMKGSWLVELLQDYEESQESMVPAHGSVTGSGSSYIFTHQKHKNAQSVHPTTESSNSLNSHLRTIRDEFSFTSPRLETSCPMLLESMGADCSISLSNLLGSSVDICTVAAGIALQVFTRCPMFQYLVQEEWSVDIQALTFTDFASIDFEALVYKYSAGSFPACSFLPEYFLAFHRHVQATFASSESVTNFLISSDWVYRIESIVNGLSLPITLCAADVTKIPCIWQYYYANHSFMSFAGVAAKNIVITSNKCQFNHDTSNTDKNSKGKNCTSPDTNKAADKDVIVYDNMHMVTLMQQAMRNNHLLQREVMTNLSSGVGMVKLGLVNTRTTSNSNNNATFTNNNTNSNNTSTNNTQEFIHLLCLSPVINDNQDGDDNEDNATYGMNHTDADTDSSSADCFSACFGTKHSHKSEKDAANNNGGGSKNNSNNHATIVAVHVDMSAPATKLEDVRDMCILSFLLARLFE